MIAERLERLPDVARKLVEVLAVGGRPLPVSVVAAAAGAEEAINETVGLLSARRFLRTGLRDGRDIVETTHDRIRETIAAQLSEATLRSHHARLAQALEGAVNGGADPESIAVHWLGAGDPERAARFAYGAAEQAVAKFAFDQAARLFRFTLEHGPATTLADRRPLLARLAEALRFGGRTEESARAYLAAAEGASSGESVEFQRAAAEQLLAGGRIDEGKEILHRVLAAVGMSAPRSPVAAVFWLLVYRLWLALIGLRIKERSPDEVSPEARLRIEALSTVSLGFAIVDVIVGACMQARHLVEALRVGDRFQVARAVSIEAAHLASAGGPETRRERELVRLAEVLSEKDGSVDAAIYNAGARGIGLFNRGHWRPARELLERANASSDWSKAGLVNSRLFAVYASYFLGDVSEARKSLARLCSRAEERGDIYTPVNLRTSLAITLALLDGDPGRARRDLASAMAQWTQTGFHVQHWQAMVYGADIDVYAGEADRAYEAFRSGWPALKKSFLLHVGFIRTMTFYVGGRLAIASIQSRPDLKAVRIQEARGLLRKLAREHDPWARAVSHLLRALIENAAGNRALTIASLREGIEATKATETIAYTMTAQHRLGEMLGGDEGRELVKQGAATASSHGIRNFERWLAMYTPGTWSGPP
jgi:tetratricopeptide (TPR) repeat protein